MIGLIENGISLFEDVDSKKQRAATELWTCMLAVRRSWRRRRGFCLPRFQCLDFFISEDSYFSICICRHRRWWSRWPAYSSRGISSSLIVIGISDFISSCKYFVNANMFSFNRRDCLPSLFWHCVFLLDDVVSVGIYLDINSEDDSLHTTTWYAVPWDIAR